MSNGMLQIKEQSDLNWGKLLDVLVNITLFVLLAGSQSVDNALGGAAGVLLLLSLASFSFIRENYRPLNGAEKAWIAALLATFVSFFLSYWLRDAELRNIRSFDIPSRYLCVIPVLVLLVRSKLHEGVLWWGVIVAATSGAIFAAYQRYGLDVQMARGAANHHIVFGDIGVALAFMSLASASYFRTVDFLKKYRLQYYFPMLGFLAGLMCSLLSGARGGWVALPLLYALFLIWYWLRMGLLQKLLSIFSPIALLVVLQFVPGNNIQSRIDKAVSDVSGYISSHQHRNSVGARLEMFKGASLIFLESPLLGAGTDSYVEEFDKLEEAKLVKPLPKNFTHPHNEYLYDLSTRGGVGFVVLLFFIFLPIKYLWGNRKIEEVRPFVLSGLFLAVSYMQFGLSEAIFDRMYSLMFYLFVMAFIYALISQRLAEMEGVEG